MRCDHHLGRAFLMSDNRHFRRPILDLRKHEQDSFGITWSTRVSVRSFTARSSCNNPPIHSHRHLFHGPLRSAGHGQLIDISLWF